MAPVLRLAYVDLLRLLVRRRFYLMVVAATGVAAVYMQTYAQTDYGFPRNACHATTECLAATFIFLLPLLAGVVAADLLAVDRSTGLVGIILSRCGGRCRYAAAKGLATAGAVALATAGVYALTLTVAAVMFPLLPPPGPGTAQDIRLFAATLFWRHPVGYVVLRWALHTLVGIAFAWTGLLASVWLKTPYVVSGVPLASCLVLTFLLVPAKALSPFAPMVFIFMTPQTQMLTVGAYWGTWAFIALVSTVLLFRRRDCHD